MQQPKRWACGYVGTSTVPGQFFRTIRESRLDCRAMSVLDDFARIRLYPQRASEFEWLADNEPISSVRLRYRIIARHYSELAYREEQSDKARMTERLAQLKQKRAELAEQKGLRASKPSFFLQAAE
jgi:hypothetical protein